MSVSLHRQHGRATSPIIVARGRVRRASRTVTLLAAAALLPACAAAGSLPDARDDTAAAAARETAAASATQPTPQDAFWNALLQLCGQAFAGRDLVVPETETELAGRRLVMHVRECTDTEIRIPLHADQDRSRTWVVRRVAGGLELKHIHRYEDGSESTNSRYGGTTRLPGTPHRQEFPADAFSIGAVPERASQWWYLEIYPGSTFAYGLYREETGLRYRFEFDTTRPVAAPPPPWGS